MDRVHSAKIGRFYQTSTYSLTHSVSTLHLIQVELDDVDSLRHVSCAVS